MPGKQHVNSFSSPASRKGSLGFMIQSQQRRVGWRSGGTWIRGPRCAVARDPLGEQAPTSSQATKDSVTLVCPICQTTPVDIITPSTMMVSTSSSLHCSLCHRTFDHHGMNGKIKNLTVTSGIPSARKSFEKRGPNSVEIFKNPLISTIYERGWRQSFSWAGFPGVEEEASMAMDVLRPVCSGQPVIDMSCGSGLFTRKFLHSGDFSHIFAVDYSTSMLQETLELLKQDPSIDPQYCTLIQADAARLPFETSSMKGIHAGAAIHCWPDPVQSVAEMSRVLSPGGIFIGTTFLSYIAPLGELVANDDIFKGLRNLEPSYNSFRFWNEDELRDLCLCCGMSSFTVVKRQFRYIMFAATK